MLIQNAAIQTASEFWPTTAAGWIAVVGGLLVVVAAIGAVIRWVWIRPLNVSDGLRAHGERMGLIEGRLSKNEGRLDSLDRASDRASYERKASDERLTRLENMIENLSESVVRHREVADSEVRQISASVSRMEGVVEAQREMVAVLMTRKTNPGG